MELNIKRNGTLEINNARIIFRNFKGEGSLYNAEGNRTFSVVIPDQELVDMLMDDKNEFGTGWNVKIRQPRDEDEAPFMHLPVKVKYTERSKPEVYLETSDGRREKLDEDTIGLLDHITIRSVDMDIRPYDGEGRFGAFRSAYLQRIWVRQEEVDRFASRFADEEYPEE